jgi:hypothetical protein
VGGRRWPAAAAAVARVFGEGRAHRWQCVTWGGAMGPREATHVRGGPEVLQGDGLLAEATAARKNGGSEVRQREEEG